MDELPSEEGQRAGRGCCENEQVTKCGQLTLVLGGKELGESSVSIKKYRAYAKPKDLLLFRKFGH